MLLKTRMLVLEEVTSGLQIDALVTMTHPCILLTRTRKIVVANGYQALEDESKMAGSCSDDPEDFNDCRLTL